jgi:hypothetical protein
MTWAHVIVISAAMGLAVFCGSTSDCNAHLDGVLQLATMVVGGALGHAGHTLKASVRK